jgi:hypothetical protein
MASILLDVTMGGDVVQDPAQVIFIVSKNPYSTKPTVFKRKGGVIWRSNDFS